MSAVGLEMPHASPHFGDDGICWCPCADCRTRLAEFCLCLDCPCESDQDHATALDPRWRWQEIHQHGGPSIFVKVGCNHLETEPVESGGQVVARLCLTCDQQLPP